VKVYEVLDEMHRVLVEARNRIDELRSRLLGEKFNEHPVLGDMLHELYKCTSTMLCTADRIYHVLKIHQLLDEELEEV